MLHHKPDSTLSDEDVERELSVAHGRRHHMFLAGTAVAWENLRLRTEELEAEYLRRFSAHVADGDQKLRNYATDQGQA